MTTTLADTRLNLAEIFETLLAGPAPIRFTAYDGSSYGPEDATVGLNLKNERGLAYMVTAPGDLGHGPRLRLRRPRRHRRAPRRPLRRHARAAPVDAVPPAVAGRGAQPAALHRAEPDAPAAAAAAGAPAALAPDGRGLPAQPGARRQGDPAPLRRLQPVLRAGARPVDDLHLRALPDGRPRPSRRRSTRSTTWSHASSTSSPASDCSTSAAAGAGWCATPPRSTASARSA